MSQKKYKVGYTTGVFDMFHVGHLNILESAAAQCEKLIVGVTTDELCFQRKNKYPIIPECDRIRIVSAIRFVSQVVLQKDMNQIEAVRELGCDAVFVGGDWKGTPEWKEYEEQFLKVGCEVVYLDHTDGISSTILRERLNAE